MKKLMLSLGTVLYFMSAEAQADSVKWVKEINEQVWKPFITSFTSGDKEGFRAVHSKRITRVEIDRNLVMNYEKYFPAIDPNAPPAKRNGTSTFELRFDKRISNGNNAWESGFYKGTYSLEGKLLRSWYGRFYVILEKENGVWKILVDADTGKDANEENFKNASSME